VYTGGARLWQGGVIRPPPPNETLDYCIPTIIEILVATRTCTKLILGGMAYIRNSDLEDLAQINWSSPSLSTRLAMGIAMHHICTFVIQL